MDKRIVAQWDRNKGRLEEFLSKNTMSACNSYEEIVRLLIDHVLNVGDGDLGLAFSLDFTVIDDGDYQGTQLFILHENVDQPSIDGYWVTHTYYGSCSGCDMLLGIVGYDSESIPSAEQVSELMTLALHLIQHLSPLVGED